MNVAPPVTPDPAREIVRTWHEIARAAGLGCLARARAYATTPRGPERLPVVQGADDVTPWAYLDDIKRWKGERA